MNPTIIVQQNYDFSKLVVPANRLPGQPATTASKAAVIRPVTASSDQMSRHPNSTTAGQSDFQAIGTGDQRQMNELAPQSDQDFGDFRPSVASQRSPNTRRSIPVEIRPISPPAAPNIPPQQSQADFTSPCYSSVNTTALPEDQCLDLLATLSPNASSLRDSPTQPPTTSTRQLPESNVIPNFKELTEGIGSAPRVALALSEHSLRSASGSDRADQLVSQNIHEQSAIEIDQKFDAKVKARLDAEGQSRLADSRSTAATDQPRSDRADLNWLAQTSSHSRKTIQAEAEKVTQEFLHGSQEEVPSNVAAWDVEDFRWPEITNQMIVSGGNALNRLHESLADIIRPQKSRIIVGGVGRGEGTTSIAISLARWIAARGKKVLLVDGDLTKTDLSRQAGMAKDISWLNSVSHSLPNAELTVRSQKSNLCIMPLASVESRSQWPRFIYDELGKIIDQAQGDFDLIITDVGPVEQMMAELSRPSGIADATVLVHDGVQSGTLKTAQNRIKMFGLSNLIIAQNRATLPTQNAA